MFGTWLNTATVIAGSMLGLVIGNRLPENIRRSVFTALGLVTFAIGVSMVIHGTEPLIIIMSIVLGGLIGELIGIERLLGRLALWIQSRIKTTDGQFVRGFVTASLLFCAGPMTVVGSIQDGVSGDSSLLVTKSILDGVSAATLAATMGIGVIFSAGVVLLLQGGLSLLGASLSYLTEPRALDQLSAVGGLLIIGLAIRMLEIKDVPVGNYLPALVIVSLAVLLF